MELALNIISNVCVNTIFQQYRSISVFVLKCLCNSRLSFLTKAEQECLKLIVCVLLVHGFTERILSWSIHVLLYVL